MKRSVPMARSGKLKSAHWSSQDDYRFGNQSPGKWQKKETKPVQLGKQNAKAVQPTVGPLPSHNCWLKDFLLEPTFSCSFAYSFIFSVANRLRHIYEISLSTCLSSPLFFFSSLFPSYLLNRVKVIPSYMACFQRIVTFISSQYFKNPC